MLKLGPFGGITPRTGDRLLPDTGAQAASNIKLQSGELRPLHSLKLTHTPSSPKTLPPLTIFRARDGASTASWFTWPIDVDCVRVPLATDVESRFCWTGDGPPKMALYSNAVSGGGSNYPLLANELTLGIPAPTTAVSVSHSGGSGSAATRFYRYTFVSQYGEESAPSPVSAEVTGKVDGTWAIGATTAMQAVPLNTGTVSSTTRAGDTITAVTSAYNWLRVGESVTVAGVTTMTEANGTFTVTAVASNGLSFSYDVTAAATGSPGGAGTWTRKTPWNTSGMYRRLYRTTGSTGAWQLVSEYVSTDPLYAGWGSATTFSDTYTDAQIAGDDLISEGWEPPPVGLRGLCVHSSGSLIGFVGNLLCMSEPLQPHAWPTAYQLSASYDGVAVETYGSTIVMATAGVPFVAAGVEPASMTGEDVKGMYPCLSKRSIVSIGNGVLYASKHGQVLVGAEGVGIFTDPFFTRDEWDLLNPDTMICETANGRLYIAYTADNSLTKMLVFDGPLLTEVDLETSALYADVSSGELYLGTSEGVMLFDAIDRVVLSGNWRSKEFVFPAPVNLGAAKIDFDLAVDSAQQAAATTARNAALATNAAIRTSGNAQGAINASQVNEKLLHGSDFVAVPDAPAVNTVTFNLWQGDTLKASRVVSNTKAFRLPGGYKADNYSVEVITQCRVKEIRVAETMDGLRGA